jgi:hypothetical protein
MTSSASFSSRRRGLVATAALLPLAGAAGVAHALAANDGSLPPQAIAALQAAVDGPQRSAANRARDGARHPLETWPSSASGPMHR